jgi:hypothetical protein
MMFTPADAACTMRIARLSCLRIGPTYSGSAPTLFAGWRMARLARVR